MINLQLFSGSTALAGGSNFSPRVQAITVDENGGYSLSFDSTDGELIATLGYSAFGIAFGNETTAVVNRGPFNVETRAVLNEVLDANGEFDYTFLTNAPPFPSHSGRDVALYLLEDGPASGFVSVGARLTPVYQNPDGSTFAVDSAMASNGVIASVVAYDGRGGSYGINGTLPDTPPEYDLALRQADGTITTIDLASDVLLSPPAIAAFGNDTFILAYSGENADLFGPGGMGGSLSLRIVDTDGNAVTNRALDNPVGVSTEPSIAIMADGNAFVVWQNNGNIRGEIIAPDGTTVSASNTPVDFASAFSINNLPGSVGLNPQAIALQANQVLVVWEDTGGATDALVGVVVDAFGNAVSNQLTLDADITGVDMDSLVSNVLTDGRVVLAWNGTNGAEQLIVDPRPQTIFADGVVVGRDAGVANDTIVSGDGADTLFGLGGNDALYSAGGADVVYGGAGNDTVLGGAGDDILWGQEGADALYGEDGADIVLAGTGDDIVYGNAGLDQLYGEAGNDILVAGAGNDYAFGGEGVDVLYGEGGVDTLLGGAGNDFLFGQADVDILYGEAGQDTVYGGDGGDFLYGGADTDALYGEAGGDTLLGGDGADFLFGGADTDVLYGEAGNDAIYGGAGNDFIFTGAGRDVVFIEGGGGTDQIFDFTDGEDAIAFVGAGPASVADLAIVQGDGYTVIGYNAQADGRFANLIYLNGVTASDLDANDFFFG